MKAIFAGTIALGFYLQHVVDDKVADSIVKTWMFGSNKLAEAMTVLCPTTLDKNAITCQDGEYFVIFGKCLSNGFKVYGPFVDDEKAEDFGENHRAEDDEYEIASVAE